MKPTLIIRHNRVYQLGHRGYEYSPHLTRRWLRKGVV